MGLTKGDIVLVKFPFTDLSQTKLRPAVVLAANLAIDEITLCFISSQRVNQLNAAEHDRPTFTNSCPYAPTV